MWFESLSYKQDILVTRSLHLVIIKSIYCIPFFENAADFKKSYLGTAVTDQNFIPQEIKRRLNSGNAWLPCSSENLSSCLTSKNVKIRIYRIIICLWFYMCWNLGSGVNERTYDEGVWEQGAEEYIWNEAGRSYYEVGENCIMRSSITWVLRQK
jgi:hypothetical protein